MMATHLHIIHAGDFLIATPQGQLDFEKSRKLLDSLASASSSLVTHEILLDMRHTQLALTATELWQLAAGLSRRRTTFSGKVAVLARSPVAGRAAFFALCAQNRGFPVSAFTSFEEAVNWLVAQGPQQFREIE
jgi:hypothetical protein